MREAAGLENRRLATSRLVAHRSMTSLTSTLPVFLIIIAISVLIIVLVLIMLPLFPVGFPLFSLRFPLGLPALFFSFPL